MQEVVVIAIMACWVSEWSKLVQKAEWFIGKIPVLNCSKCLSFWWMLVYGLVKFEPMQALCYAVLCSATAMVMNKIYMRL